MELREFVSEVIRQIVCGVKDAQDAAEEVGALVNPSDMTGILGGEPYRPTVMPRGRGNYRRFLQRVHFDVAVTATEGSEKKGGVGVVVTVLALGGQKATATKTETVSRVRFSVPVTMPVHPDGSPKAKADQPPARPVPPPGPPRPST